MTVAVYELRKPSDKARTAAMIFGIRSRFSTMMVTTRTACVAPSTMPDFAQ